MARRLRAPNIAKTWQQLRDSVWDIYQFINPTVTRTDGDYTTNPKSAWEIVKTTSTGTGTQTITLHKGARDLARRTIKRGGSAPVTIDTEGSETIDGSATKTVTNQYDSVDMYYDEASTDWMPL